MKVTTQQVFKLCETIHNLKRLGDQHAKSKDWERETFASCELANSIMNNMTSVDGTIDSELKARIATLENCVEAAWGIIANVSRGNWNEQRPEWQEAARKWRDRYVISAARLWRQMGG